jgi:hypothetical protein
MRWGGLIRKTWTVDLMHHGRDLRIVIHWCDDKGFYYGTVELMENGMYQGQYLKQLRSLGGDNCWTKEECLEIIENPLNHVTVLML